MGPEGNNPPTNYYVGSCFFLDREELSVSTCRRILWGQSFFGFVCDYPNDPESIYQGHSPFPPGLYLNIRHLVELIM